MAEKGRLQKSMWNLIGGFSYRLLSMLTAFVVRTIFIRCLSEAYLGINGLYTNILNMLSLAELGFGTAMVYSMYKPLAEKDDEKLSQLLRLYKRVYTIMGTVILVLGLALIPFLDVLIKNKPDVEGLTFYYVMFLLNTVVSYWFFAYRNSVLHADQKSYIVSKYNSAFNLIKSALQIVVLLCFKNYTVYLLTQILCTIAENIALAVKVKKEYPGVLQKKESELPKEDKTRIFRDVKALMLGKISFVTLSSSDTIIISAFIGVNWVGLLSNFTMIVDAITGVLTQITSAISASLGNFFAKEDKEEGFQLFNRIEFMNFWLYGFSSVALFVLLNPFVTVWIGEKFTLSNMIVIALVIRFFVAGYMNTCQTFRSTLGLFVQGQYRSIAVALVNIALSILLSKPLGVAGVLFATSISRLLINMWYDPWVLHRDGFGKSVKPFYIRYSWRIVLLIAVSVLMTMLSKLIFAGGITILRFALMTVLTAIIPNLIFLAVFFRTEEFRYFCVLINEKVLSKFKKQSIISD